MPLVVPLLLSADKDNVHILKDRIGFQHILYPGRDKHFVIEGIRRILKDKTFVELGVFNPQRGELEHVLADVEGNLPRLGIISISVRRYPTGFDSAPTVTETSAPARASCAPQKKSRILCRTAIVSPRPHLPFR
ncbi:hypothetical protein [Pyramidobacter sp.]|uniref:hypothetical protein n=1 Tax=Pyramidobacter sp. TaxID=1943581 RepID=UPI0025F1D59A|nr:hypothetical protein [Pyramidobacter sp.]